MNASSFVTVDLRSGLCALQPAPGLGPTTSKIATALRLAFDDDVAERPEIVVVRQSGPGVLADDNPRPVLLVQRFEPRPEVHGVADHRVAHDRVRADIAGDHRARC